MHAGPLCGGQRHHCVGERINPTGKKRLQQALRDGDSAYPCTQAVAQAEAGAQVLDVNAGLPGIDEAATLEQLVKDLQAVTDLPLQLDSSNPEALSRALRIYNGKPIVNSVNGEPETLEKILPLCKKYGAAVVGLALDKGGIPPTAEGRFAIAQRIVAAANAAGIPNEDIYIDCLTLTASASRRVPSRRWRLCPAASVSWACAPCWACRTSASACRAAAT